MTSTTEPALHASRRVRHELTLRLLTVRRVQRLSASMRRVTLAGEALRGFTSAAADDHVKVFFPEPGGERPTLPGAAGQPSDGPGPIARDYTPRRYDDQAGELDLDFVLHGEGPAAHWAAHAAVGQQLGVGGPRGSQVVACDFDWYLLIGDETALPAIGRRLEELPAGSRTMVLAEVANADEVLPWAGDAAVQVRWLYRAGALAGHSAVLIDAARTLQLPPGDGYIWIAGESGVSRALREHFVTERGCNPAWIKAAGYWKRGAVATHDKHD